MDNDNKMLSFKHIGHTLIYENHKSIVNEQLVSYDGMINPKIQIDDKCKFPDVSIVNL